MRSELIVLPSRAQVQAHRTATAQLAPNGVCFGANVLAMQEFEQLLIGGLLGPQAPVLSDFEERCRIRSLMTAAPLRGLFGERLIDSPGFVPAVQRSLHAHQQLAPGPNQLSTSSAQLFHAWEQDLKMAGLWSRHAALREVTTRLLDGYDLPTRLMNVSRIIFKHSFELSFLQTGLIEALSTRLAGVAEVIIEIPYQDSSSGYFRHSARQLEQFERTGDRLQTTVLPSADSDTLGVGPALLSCLLQLRASAEVPWSSISLHQSTSVFRERLAVTEQVHAWLAEGIAPDQIVIAMRHLDYEAQQLSQALKDSGVPVQAIPQAALLASPLLRWFTTLLSLSHRPWHPQQLTDVLASNYAMGLHNLDTQAIARGLAWLLPYDYSDRQALIDTLERHAGRDSRACGRALVELKEQLEPFGTSQSLANFVQLTRRLMAQCNLHRNLPLPARTAQDLRTLIVAEDGIGTELGMAMGCEDLGLNALEQVLSNLELVATRLTTELSPKQYWDMLIDGLRSQNVYPPGPRSGAIKLVSVRDLVGTQVEAIVIPQLVDGRFPTSSRNASVLAQGDAGNGAAEGHQAHHEKETLLFALAIHAAKRRLALSHAIYDAAGREATPALFMQECLLAARHAGQANSIQTHPEAPVSLPQRAFGTDRLGRAIVHALAPLHPGQTSAEVAAMDVPIPLTAPSNLVSTLHRVVIERQRLAHAYAKGNLFKSPYTGQIQNDAIAVPGSKNTPLSPTQLNTAARCPFQDFVGRVLRLGRKPLPHVDVDPRDDGQLAHECFEAAMLAIIAQRVGPYKPENAKAACATALEAINHHLLQQQQRQLLPPGLFAYRAERLRRRLLSLIENMYLQDEAFEPIGVEIAFDCQGPWPPLEFRHPGLDMPIWLHGRIDLLEQNGNVVRATDLKRTGAGRLRDELKPDVLGHTSLQLPIYAAACHAHSSSQACDARFLSLKDGVPMPSLRSQIESHRAWKKGERSSADVLMLALPNGELTSLGESIGHLTAAMRSNDYALNPAKEACLRCDLAALCRVPSLDLPESS